MKRTTVVRDFTIGMAFLGALAVFGWGTLKVVSLDVFGLTRDIEVPFTEVSGVRVGDDVKFYGFKVGLVTAVTPRFQNPDHKLLVRCRINSEVTLPADSVFRVKSAGPLGGRFIEIVPGTSDRNVAIETGSFTGDSEKDIFENLGALVDEVREGNGLLNQLIENDTVGEDFAAIIAGVRKAVDDINAGQGILGALINRQDLRERAEQLITDVGDTFRNINQGEGTIAMLINDAETRDNVKTSIANIEEISTTIKEGRGTVGRLIMEEKIYQDLEEAVAGVKDFVKDVREGDGTLAMLANDTEFKNSLKEGVAEIKDTFSAINEGEGTLGQLVVNREAYDQLMRILDNVADAVEDFREQAPVSTFVNAIFSGF